MQTTSERGLKEIVGHEGLVLSPYYDAVGVLTIYVGHTAKAGPPDPAACWNRRGSIAEALDVLRRDLSRCEAAVRAAFTVALNEPQFDAAVSFQLNTGGIARASWVRYFNRGELDGARVAFMSWRRPVAIIPRRERERDLFFSGIYHWGGEAMLYPADRNGRVEWANGANVLL